MARTRRYTVNPPMTQAQYDAHLRERAEERQRRGFPSFTRPERAEQVMGQVPESPMGRAARLSQVNTGRKRRR